MDQALDAGFAFVTSYEALEKNGFTNDILAAMALWEDARMKGVFTDEQKQLMEDVNNEFHLEEEDGRLLLSRIHTYRLNHEKKQRQPGEPVTTSLDFENPGSEQPMHFIITAKKGAVINPQMEIDGSRMITIPVKLDEGQHIKYNGEFASVYSAEWQLLKSISLNRSILNLGPGTHNIEASCNFKGIEGEMLLEIRLKGESFVINKP